MKGYRCETRCCACEEKLVEGVLIGTGLSCVWYKEKVKDER